MLSTAGVGVEGGSGGAGCVGGLLGAFWGCWGLRVLGLQGVLGGYWGFSGGFGVLGVLGVLGWWGAGGCGGGCPPVPLPILPLPWQRLAPSPGIFLAAGAAGRGWGAARAHGWHTCVHTRVCGTGPCTPARVRPCAGTCGCAPVRGCRCVQETRTHSHTHSHTLLCVPTRAQSPVSVRTLAHLHTHAAVRAEPCCHPQSLCTLAPLRPVCTSLVFTLTPLFVRPLFLHSPCFCTTPRFHAYTTFAPSSSPRVCTPHLSTPLLLAHPPLFARPRVCNPAFSHAPCLHTHPRVYTVESYFHTRPCVSTRTRPAFAHSPPFPHPHGVCTLTPPFAHPPPVSPQPFAHSLPTPPNYHSHHPPRPPCPLRPISARLLGRCRHGGAQALRAAPGRAEGRRGPVEPTATGARGAPGGELRGDSAASPSSLRPQGAGGHSAAPLRNRWAALPGPARPGQGSVPFALSSPSAG